MRQNRRKSCAITVHTVYKDEVDSTYYEHLASIKSALSSMKYSHEMVVGSSDMISFYLDQAIAYCKQGMDEIVTRSNGGIKKL